MIEGGCNGIQMEYIRDKQELDYHKVNVVYIIHTYICFI